MESTLDRTLFSLLTRGFDAQTIKAYPENVRRHDELIPPAIAETLKSIDSKATGLLTHVSMMIAGLGLIAPLVANHDLELAAIVFEMAVYLLLAVGCLRCLSIFHPYELEGAPADVQERIGRELLIRRELYRACIRVAIAFTLVVFCLLPAMYVW